MKVFKEEQRFTQWWLWLILLSINIIFISGFILQIVLDKPFGNNPTSNIGLTLITIFTILLSLFFYFIKLYTKIDNKGISYRFSIIQRNYKTIKWSEIESIEVIKYRPMLDYGGWGIKGNGYTASGNIGIRVYLKSKLVRLIGTQKENEAKQILATYQDKIK